MINGTFLSFSLITDEYERKYDLNMLLKDFRESLLSFELMHSEIPFVIEQTSFKYKILSLVGPLGTNLTFLSPLGLLRFQGFPSFLFILKLSYSKPFYTNLNYVSTSNVQEVIKFYSLSNKTFEAGFLDVFFHTSSLQSVHEENLKLPFKTLDSCIAKNQNLTVKIK